jgi:hypothetical protein
MLEKQVAEIERESHMLFRPNVTEVLINRELSPEAQSVVAIDSED